MGYPAEVIPEKIFFKIGEVCDLVGVQAHVLRYWETEFPMLSPQKNRSGQRTYRRRDVETAMRIKELLYDELFTIAGAKKKLQSELREASRLKIVHSEPVVQRETILQPVPSIKPPDDVFEDEPEYEYEEDFDEPEMILDDPEELVPMNSEKREAIKSLTSQLLELTEMIRASKQEDNKYRIRRY